MQDAATALEVCDHFFSHWLRYLFKLKRGRESFDVEVVQQFPEILVILSMIIFSLSFGQVGCLT